MVSIVAEKVDEKTWINNISEFKYSLLSLPEWINSVKNGNSSPIYLDFKINNEIAGKISGLIFDYGNLKGKQLYFYASPILRV